MLYKRLGKTKEKVSAIGLGTWRLKAPDAAKILKYGLENEINYVDTAELYNTETVVGEAIKSLDGIFVATKVFSDHMKHDALISACNESLKRLGVKTIDVYQLHWPNPNIPIEETMGAMEELVRDGKIRYIGVCNFSIEELRTANEVLKSNEIVSNQVEYSMLIRDPEKGMMDYCRKESITVIAYSPLNRGHLYDDRYAELRGLLSKVGKEYGKTATQVAINWLISKEQVIAIPKASSREHIDELLGAANFSLKRNDIDYLDKYLDSKSNEIRPPSLAEALKLGLKF
ncbi:MAG: aldo/keto reductase [Candidatus Micrarchaeaceae archaeon]